jgi:putative FmdB family regulatory protein
MPIYAYRCRDCGKEFSTLVMSGEIPVCESCASQDLEQQLSLIAAPKKGGESAPAMAAACDMMGGCGCEGACPAFADA